MQLNVSWISPLLIVFSSCSSPTLPDKWRKLGIPAENIVSIDEATNDNGLFVEYDNETTSPPQLYHKVDSLLKAAGYRQCCSVLDGIIRGYTNSRENLVVKVDGIGGLSIFNDKAGDKLLYGVCFKGYQLSPD